MTSSVPLQFSKDLPLVPTRVVPIPKRELRVINSNPHNKKEKGLISVPTSQGKIMWVHPDLIESQQWTTVTNRKSKGKRNALSCNVVCASSREAETDVASLTDSEEEENVLVGEQSAPPMVETRSDQQYLKKYDEAATSSSPRPKKQPSNLWSNP